MAASFSFLTSRFLQVLTALTLAIVLPRPALAGPGNPHIRTSDHRVATLVATGVAQSNVFRSMVERLNESHVVVYVEFGWLTPRLTGELRLIGAGDGWRYLRVQVACHQGEVHQIVALAHELRHALEIAEAPQVVDDSTLRQLYRSIGVDNSGNGRRFETDAAQQTASDVRRELVDGGAHAASVTGGFSNVGF